MTIRELFVFIVDPTISGENVDSYLEEVQRKVIEGGEISVEDEIADSVFMKSYIPKTLDAVKNPEADVEKIRSGQDTADMLYQTITWLRDALPKVHEQQVKVDVEKGKKEEGGEGEEEESEKEEDESESGSEEEEELGPEDKKSVRKEHKKKVKEETREARKNKTPKFFKKGKKKISKSHKTL